MEEAHDLS
ncbi:Protein of unknown function [Leuconostoc citreum]|nr:Protein of unknown function [Leuconostoc citreum LBAE C11]CCF28921.1 Protein of unknown function [Leuconostoc citreum LBAE E16]CDX64021.1 Protein of unknown function [Leuconostoc citreum]CDX65740.1 Protein of unknown function [Leuconostoc citreum]